MTQDTADMIQQTIVVIVILAIVGVFLRVWPGRKAIYRRAAIWGLAGMAAEDARETAEAEYVRKFGAGATESQVAP